MPFGASRTAEARIFADFAHFGLLLGVVYRDVNSVPSSGASMAELRGNARQTTSVAEELGTCAGTVDMSQEYEEIPPTGGMASAAAPLPRRVVSALSMESCPLG